MYPFAKYLKYGLPMVLTRSEVMSRIRSRDTKPELLLRRALWAEGLRYRLRYDISGKPDLVFVKPRVAVFLDGCFWHGCPLHYSGPGSRQDFWKTKLKKNVLRDMAVEDILTSENWRVIRIWQHDLKHMDDIVSRIKTVLRPSDAYTINTPSGHGVSEATVRYGYGPAESEWWRCPCGSEDVRVISLSGPGSLNPTSKKRPDLAELVCRSCRNTWTAKVG